MKLKTSFLRKMRYRKRRDPYWRACARCETDIIVGRAKIGRAVFPGGVCYHCYKEIRGKRW